MTGEAFALVSAFCYGLCGAAIAKGAPTARGDNGTALSIVLTALFSGILWLVFASGADLPRSPTALWSGIGFFVLAGLLATVFGRLAAFRSVALAGAIRATLFRRMIPVFAAILAFFILGERIGLGTWGGIALILGGLAMSMRERMPRALSATQTLDPARVRAGLVFGVVCAACYAGSYVARKLAMETLPDALLGALIGAVTGLVWYALAATVSKRYRAAVTGLVSTTGPWQLLAATAMSAGQVSQFFALKHTEVATVAIIGTTEVFISAYFAAFLFRTEPAPGRDMILATLLATAGVIVVALS